MTSVASPPPEQGWLVNVRFCQWIINEVRASALPPSVLNPPDKLDSFLDAVRWDGDSTADVKNIRFCFRFSIERGDDLPWRFTFKEAPSELRTVRVMANEATQDEKFVIPTNMSGPSSSVIRSLFKADGERDAATREDMGDWSDSKGKQPKSRAEAVEARKVADRVISIVQPVEPVRAKRRRAEAGSLFGEQ